MTELAEEGKKPWRLVIGYHEGTRMSRDMHSASTKYQQSSSPLESLEDCIVCARHWANYYRGMGGYLWYANAIAPDGTKHEEIIPGTDYR